MLIRVSLPVDSQLQLFGELNGHVQKLHTCAFSSNGRWLVSAGVDKKVMIWSVVDKELKYTIEGADSHTSYITNARFTPDDRLIFGTTALDSARIWDLGPLTQGTSSTVHPLQVLKGPHMDFKSIDFCPGVMSTKCVTCDASGDLRLWDFKTGQCERTIKIVRRQKWMITQLDGRFLMSLSNF